MGLVSKKFTVIIEHDNDIVRDHRVHGTRILPGVTFIDIIYRGIQSELNISDVELSNIVFMEPVATSEVFDKKILISIKQEGSQSSVIVNSRKVKNGKYIDDHVDLNVTAKLNLRQNVPQKTINIEELKSKADAVIDMDTVYGYGRKVDIQHYTFMKALGKVYQGRNYALMELSLSDLARKCANNFILHPTFLDASTFSWVASRMGRYAFDTDLKPYIPISVERFHAFSTIPEQCYVYTELQEGELAKPQQDVMYNDITILDVQGRVLAKFERFSIKCIRSNDLIARLVTNVNSEPKASIEISVPEEKNMPVNTNSKEENSIIVSSGTGSSSNDELALIAHDLTLLVAEELQQVSESISMDQAFYDIGLDSRQLLSLVNILEKKIGQSLYPTLLFEYSNINDLAKYFVNELPGVYTVVQVEPVLETINNAEEISALEEVNNNTTTKILDMEIESTVEQSAEKNSVPSNEPIAIIGLSGRYPDSPNVRELWKNVVKAKNCITEIPKSHWDIDDKKSINNDSINSRWGGFIEDADKFDAQFFSVTPREADGMDPQLRLLLEESWHTLEDAGYTPESLAKDCVGVYMGVMNNDYTWVSAEHYLATGKYESFGSYAHDLANRVSYFMDFDGPSLSVQTACSSSLTAIHTACKAIQSGECETALAGGVNLSLHRSKYMMLSELDILSSDGVERTFDENANGYVPGEGVGLVLLKSLSQAIKDHDHIYGLVTGSAVNHSGKGSGLFVPNIKRMTSVGKKALGCAGIEAQDLDYIETHGSGTSLGDPIEVKALSNLFAGNTQYDKRVVLGSKANIGHLESASGICSLSKVLMSMQYKTLPPCANVDALNPNIPLQNTPFTIPLHAKNWQKTKAPRRAAINSFGIGGSNAFMVLEEFVPAIKSSRNDEQSAFIFVFSARTDTQLLNNATALRDYLVGNYDRDLNLGDIAYTLQVGRKVMHEKLAIIAHSVTELKARLRCFILDKMTSVEQKFIKHGNPENRSFDPKFFEGDEETIEIVVRWAKKNKLDKIAEMWVNGVTIDWQKLPQNNNRYKVSLPTYPFAKKRYWIDQSDTNVEPVGKHMNSVDPELLLTVPEWQNQPLDFNAPLTRLKSILVFDINQNFKESMHSLVGEDTNVIVVIKGPSFLVNSDGTVAINPRSKDDYRNLVQWLVENNEMPDLIIHRWCGLEYKTSQKRIDEQFNQGFISLLYLHQALSSVTLPRDTNMLCLYPNDSKTTQPLFESLLGMLRTLKLEMGRMSYQLIGHENKNNNELAHICLNETSHIQLLPQHIHYRNKERLMKNWVVKDYHQQQNNFSLDGDQSHVNISSGTYLISGGTGGLGVLVAEYLSENGASHVVLLGRSTLNEESSKRIELLNKTNVTVHFEQVDVIERVALKEAIKKIEMKYGSIKGVVHSAGIIKDQILLNKTADDALQVLAPKLNGLNNLDEFTQNCDLDFFVSFSSITSIVGNVGQGDYAFANACMDSCIAFRNTLVEKGKRKGKSISINWPLWRDGGMQVDDQRTWQYRQDTGLEPLTAEAGKYILNLILSLDAEAVCPLLGDIRKMELGLPFDLDLDLDSTLNISDSEVHALEIEKAVSKDIQKIVGFDGIKTYVIDVISTLTRIPANELSTTESFQEMGIDSLLTLRIFRELDKLFAELPRTLFMECENTEELIAYLQDKSIVNEFNVEPKVSNKALKTSPKQNESAVKLLSVDHETHKAIWGGDGSVSVESALTKEMEGYEFITTENPLNAYKRNAIGSCTSACIACYPYDMLKAMAVDHKPLFNALHNGGLETLLLRVYATNHGNIAQLLIPMTQEEIVEESDKRKSIFIAAFELAKKMGAKTVSLQQTLPSATNYGRDVVKYLEGREDLPKVSTGHSVTVSAVVTMIDEISKIAGRSIQKETVGFLGLGSIGGATLRLMLDSLPHPKKIILCDVYMKSKFLEQVKQELKEDYNFKGEIKVVCSKKVIPISFYNATLIVGATNVPDVLQLNKVKSGTLIVDDSAPHCFDPAKAFKRFDEQKDILFTEGGLLTSADDVYHLRYAPDLEKLLPGQASAEDSAVIKGYSYEQKPREILGCALAGLLNTCFSEDIPPTLGLIERKIAATTFKKIRELGFGSASLRCRGKVLDAEIINEFRENYGMLPNNNEEQSRKQINEKLT